MFILKHAVVGNWKSWRKNSLLVSTLCILLASIALLIVIYLTADSSILSYQKKYGQQVMISSKETDQQHAQKLTKEQYQKFGQSDYLKEMKLFSNLMVILNQQNSAELQENQDIRIMATTILSGVEAKDFDLITQSNEIVQGKDNLAENECFISEEYSNLNKLAVGDTFSFQTINKQGNLSQEIDLVIAGIYKPIENQKKQMEEVDYIQKFFIYTSMETVASKKELTENSDYLGVFELKEAKLLSDFKKDLYQKGLSKSYEVTMSEETIQGYISQLEEVKRGISIILVILLSFSTLLMSALVVQLFRKKEEEFFVLQELGMSKGKIFLYRATSILSTTMGSFIFSCVIVIVLSPTVLHWLSSYQSIAPASSFEVVGVSFTKSQNPVMEQIVSIRSSDRIHFLAILFGISLLLWVVMVLVEGYCILKAKAMKFLLERT